MSEVTSAFLGCFVIKSLDVIDNPHTRHDIVELTYRRGISDGDPSKGTQLEDDIRNENQWTWYFFYYESMPQLVPNSFFDHKLIIYHKST